MGQDRYNESIKGFREADMRNIMQVSQKRRQL